MNGDGQAKRLFLLDQKLQSLRDHLPEDERRYHLCGDEKPTEKIVERPWEPELRFTPKSGENSPIGIVERALSGDPWKRVALVCEAGFGKSTNMTWLQAHLAQRGGRQLPLLLHLESHEDLENLLVKEHSQPGTLLNHLANQIDPSATADRCRHLLALSRLKEQGRITLLLDGLDHAISRGNIPTILTTLMERWKNCPIWISGRPYAFKLAWETVFKHDQWKFVRVEPLDRPEVRFYLTESIEPEKSTRSDVDWFRAIPDDGQHLLAIPRFLRLIAGILKPKVAAAKAQDRDPQAAIEEFDLRTKADVYYRAYFEPGIYIPPEQRTGEQDTRLNDRGLIAQGLDVWMDVGRERKYLGLKKGDQPNADDHVERIRSVAALLGAIAFEMYLNPDQHRSKVRANNKATPLEPNTTGVPEDKMSGFRDAVEARLKKAGQFKGDSMANEFALLTKANNGTVDFLLFNELTDKGLAWHDRTVQAFFSACWAMNYATPKELSAMDGWKVVLGEAMDGWRGEESRRLEGFDEFWQFAAEMPKELLHDLEYKRWFHVFKPSYTPPAELPGEDYEMVQWHRRMIYHSYVRMEERSPETINDWRALWLKLERGEGSAAQQAALDTIKFCNCPPTLDEKSFVMGSPESDPDRFFNEEVLRQVMIKPFRLQDFPVTNAQYELFDPKHKKQRDKYSKSDGQPVNHVTFWDAWCFAKWTGNWLPREAEWEYACRAGTPTRYHFGDEIDKTLCNYDGNVGRMTAKGEFSYPKNQWGLFDMHGNVFEWCNSRYSPGASERVLRGGNLSFNGRRCRSAYRNGSEPDYRHRDYGFRLAADPVGAKPGKEGRAKVT